MTILDYLLHRDPAVLLALCLMGLLKPEPSMESLMRHDSYRRVKGKVRQVRHAQ